MSPSELFILTGFITGAAGSIHCAAMCGGLVGIISESMKTSFASAFVYWCGYNFGRVTSYAVAGFLVAGALQHLTGALFESGVTQSAGLTVAGLFMVILGGHIAKWWGILTVVETAGARVWNRIVPVFSRCLPPKYLHHSFIGGLLWGWLPCGFVYSTLAMAAASGDALTGAATMFAFGLGTLPMLFVMGSLTAQLKKTQKIVWVRHVLGGVICGYGTALFLGWIPLHRILH